uniref:Transmembrane protein FAM155A-like n=1 Tax=Astyanax mexicanus TaxID=7994 RepID=A0A8B9R7U0_ASTMX
MTSGAREARQYHRQRDDGGSNPCTRCWRWCWYWCCWYWWWWWCCCAHGRSSSSNKDNNDSNNNDSEEEEEDNNDAQPISTDCQRAWRWRWRRSLASFLFLTGLLSERLGPACASLGTDIMDSGTGTEAGSGMGTGTGTGHEPCSLRSNEDVIFIANCSTENCLTFVDADHLCKGLWGALVGAGARVGAEGGAEGGEGEWSALAARLRLSFCDSYSLMDLLEGRSRPDLLNCSVDAMRAGDLDRCSTCVQAYQSYDVHAQEKYEEFELMTERYVTDAYSVRTCMEECKIVYKPWLCAQFFQSNQSNCSRKVPCEQYCLEVQQRCPFILPDNDDLIHGGTPSFICTGLSETGNAEQEPQCCDVRWDLKSSNRSRGTFKRTHPSCQHGSSAATTGAAASSGAPRLGQGRLKLCLLVLVLLHTVATMTASQNSTCLAGIFPLEDNNTPREE